MRVLAPGKWRGISVFGGGTLRLRTGTYNARSFQLEATTPRASFDVKSGPIDVNVQGNLRFGDKLQAQLIGSTNPRLVRFYTNSTNPVNIDIDLTLYVVVTAPSATITAYRTSLRGSPFGKLVTMEPDVNVPPGRRQPWSASLEDPEHARTGVSSVVAPSARCTVMAQAAGITRSTSLSTALRFCARAERNRRKGVAPRG